MQKYIVIRIPPEHRERPTMIASAQNAIRSVLDEAAKMGLGEYRIVPDADVAVLKSTDPHARVAMAVYLDSTVDNAGREVAVAACEWANNKSESAKWATDPTHAPD